MCHVVQVHDIEDLVRVGKDVKACPYFAARKYAGKVKDAQSSCAC
jgi:hypothetical protein